MGGGKGGGKGGKGMKGGFMSMKAKMEQQERIEKMQRLIASGQGTSSIWVPRRVIPKKRARTGEGEMEKYWIAAAEWGQLERGYRADGFVYHDTDDKVAEVEKWSSGGAAKGDGGIRMLEKLYCGKLQGGQPPTAGAQPSSWPALGGEGSWNRSFPQELLVGDMTAYLRSLNKRRRMSKQQFHSKIRSKKTTDLADDDDELEEEELSDADDDYKHDHYADEDKSEEGDDGSEGDF